MSRRSERTGSSASLSRAKTHRGGPSVTLERPRHHRGSPDPYWGHRLYEVGNKGVNTQYPYSTNISRPRQHQLRYGVIYETSSTQRHPRTAPPSPSRLRIPTGAEISIRPTLSSRIYRLQPVQHLERRETPRSTRLLPQAPAISSVHVSARRPLRASEARAGLGLHLRRNCGPASAPLRFSGDAFEASPRSGAASTPRSQRPSPLALEPTRPLPADSSTRPDPAESEGCWRRSHAALIGSPAASPPTWIPHSKSPPGTRRRGVEFRGAPAMNVGVRSSIARPPRVLSTSARPRSPLRLAWPETCSTRTPPPSRAIRTNSSTIPCFGPAPWRHSRTVPSLLRRATPQDFSNNWRRASLPLSRSRATSRLLPNDNGQSTRLSPRVTSHQRPTYTGIACRSSAIFRHVRYLGCTLGATCCQRPHPQFSSHDLQPEEPEPGRLHLTPASPPPFAATRSTTARGDPRAPRGSASNPGRELTTRVPSSDVEADFRGPTPPL